MVEKWVSTQAGRHLSGRRKKDTAPELLLRKALHAAGLRFRLHRQLAKGCTPDIVLPSRRIAIFVDGCFWHGCPRHGRKTPWTGPNAELWRVKLERNHERDARSTSIAKTHGWRVIRVWECTVAKDVARVSLQIRDLGGRLGAEAVSSDQSRKGDEFIAAKDVDVEVRGR
ncbi:MAG: very short patch repair endonuclease [Actinomycetales bacterium]